MSIGRGSSSSKLRLFKSFPFSLLASCSSLLSIAFATLIWSVCAVSAADPAETWNQANQAYQQRNYARADALYAQLVSEGMYSRELFFNLANSYVQRGDKGQAILNYQRALVLDPQFAPAKANLHSLVQSVGELEPESIRFALGYYSQFFLWGTVVSGWLAILGLAWLALRSESNLARLVLFVAIPLFLVTGALLAWIGPGNRSNKLAFTIRAPIDIRFGPGRSARVIRTLGLGVPLRLLSVRGEWSLCEIEDGASGWVPTETVDTIVPR